MAWWFKYEATPRDVIDTNYAVPYPKAFLILFIVPGHVMAHRTVQHFQMHLNSIYRVINGLRRYQVIAWTIDDPVHMRKHAPMC